MKQLKFLFTLCLFSLLAVSCGDDDDNPGNINCNDLNDVTALNAAIADEINALAIAANNYFNDMNSANCNAYKDAYQDWIDILKSLEDCANDLGQGTQWQQDILDAEADLANLC